MSRRGGGNHPDNRRSQPSPAQQSSVNAAGSGRGRGRGSRGGRTAGSSSSVHPPPPSYASAPVTVPPSVAAPVVPPSVAAPVVPPSIAASVASSSSAPNLPSPATVSIETLSAEVKQKATLQSAPSSQKAIRFPNRPDYGRLGRKIQVRANHFQLQVADRDLHHYDVSISPEITSKKVCRDIINQLVKMYRESQLDNRIPAYDGRKSLFTAGPLPFTSKVFVVVLTDDNRGSSSDSDRKKREREFKVTIKFASKTDLYNLTQFLRRMQLDCPYETIQALDVALRATPSENYIVAGRSFFSPSLGQPGPLGGGTEYYRGFYQSIRPTQIGLTLNIDVSSRAFYEPILVTDFVSKHFKLNFSRPLSDQDRVKIKKALRDVKVKLSHSGKIRSCKVTGVSREPLRDLTFMLEDNVTRKKVIDYFYEKYNIVLKHPVLPALQAGSDSRPMFFPMELCQIEPGQRYSKRLNEEQVTALLRATCQRPPQRENDIKHIVKQHHFNTDNVVKEFGINVREELALVDARVLPPPTLKYHGSGGGSKIDPQMGQWNMINKKMVDAGKVQFWTCICFASRMDPTQFCAELVNMCRSKGMDFNPDPLIPIFYWITLMEEESTSHATVESNASDRIKLNVGGKLFETTLSTIRSDGPDSLLYDLSNRSSNDPNPVFIDRDPEIFSVLLSLLRTNHLPSTALRFSKQELADEANFYGIDSHLRAATSPPPFSGIDASIVGTVRPASEGFPSTFTAADNGSVWIAHGGQLSSYDWNLIHSATVRTHLDEIKSICRVWPEIAAVGTSSDAGLHFYNFSGSRHVGSVHWSDPTDPRIFKARVNAITASENSVFASFDCSHRENCILEVDKAKIQIVSQLGRQSGNQAKHMVPMKLTWIQTTGVLVGSAVTGGAFGYSGYIRLWDPRSGEVVWETHEPGASGRSSRFGDSFSAIEVDVEKLLLFKLCSKSGDLAMADMRRLGDDPWVYLKEKNPSLWTDGGDGSISSVVHCYKEQVFVGRGGELEVWSRVQEVIECESERESDGEGVYRRNFVDKREDSGKGVIKKIEGGGDRLFISREDVEGIEVWESSHSAGAISVL